MQASAAAAGAGVLGDKHRMPAHRRLLAVIGDACRCKPRSDEVGSVALNGLQALVRLYCLSCSLKWNFARNEDFCRCESVFH